MAIEKSRNEDEEQLEALQNNTDILAAVDAKMQTILDRIHGTGKEIDEKDKKDKKTKDERQDR